MIKLGMITTDTTDARELAGWWAKRLGGQIVDDLDGWFCIVRIPESSVTLGFQKVSEVTPGKNRVHLDLDRSLDADRASSVAEWVAAGATHLASVTEAGLSWDTFLDPHGNEFCLGDPE